MHRRSFLKLAALSAGGRWLPAELPLRMAGENRAAVPGAPHPGWWRPPELPVLDGRNDPAADPARIPQNGDRIRDLHFRNWRADGIWPEAKRSGVVFAWRIEPGGSWSLENCRFSDCFGEVVTGRYGMNLKDLWFENLSNIGVLGNSTMTLHGRNLNFRNVSMKHPEISWDHAGAVKVTGFDAVIEPWVDIDGFRVYHCPNGPYFWADTGPVIRKLWNASFTGGTRTRGLMLELAFGDPAYSPSLKNIEMAHSNIEPHPGQPWNHVFNGVVLMMNSRGITAENLTVITPPRVSAFAFQDDHRRHDKLKGRKAVMRDIDLRGGLIVLRGKDSTLERHYWHVPGRNGAGKNIRIRDFEVWVEAGTQTAAAARCESPFASGLRIKAMTAGEIEAGLKERGQGHLLESHRAEIRQLPPE